VRGFNAVRGGRKRERKRKRKRTHWYSFAIETRPILSTRSRNQFLLDRFCQPLLTQYL
jgi:hypothetical protein